METSKESPEQLIMKKPKVSNRFMRTATVLLWAIFAIAAGSLAFQSVTMKDGELMVAFSKAVEPDITIESLSANTAHDFDLFTARSSMLENRLNELAATVSQVVADNVVLQEIQAAESSRISQIEGEFDSLTASIEPVDNTSVAAPTSIQIDGGLPLPAIKPETGSGEIGQVHVPFPVTSKDLARSGNMPDPAFSNPLPGLGNQGNPDRSDFAIAIARGTDIEALVQTWMDTKENNQELLAKLEPRVRFERTTNSGLELVLVAGPLRNAGDAASLCTALKSFDETCQPVIFSGDPVPQASQFSLIN